MREVVLAMFIWAVLLLASSLFVWIAGLLYNRSHRCMVCGQKATYSSSCVEEILLCGKCFFGEPDVLIKVMYKTWNAGYYLPIATSEHSRIEKLVILSIRRERRRNQRLFSAEREREDFIVEHRHYTNSTKGGEGDEKKT